GDKRKALDVMIEILKTYQEQPIISRVERKMINNFVDASRFEIDVDKSNFDYVYLSEDLIKLKGNRYHRKKNHLNRFKKTWDFEFRSMNDVVIDEVLRLQEDWCEFKECDDNQDLFHEDQAIYEALKNYRQLKFKGGVILIDGKVEAFSFGEKLNPETAVIHVEKANPEIQGLYTAINQMFASDSWSDVKYINREQDLGLEGLRKAKESYYPVHMVEKYVLKEKS
ncbi:MAG: phosphatidylglycerol lysyltransferase domain-containing protein, partial [Pseudomonadota bacterium]